MASNTAPHAAIEFLDDIRLGRQPQPGIADAQAALGIVERVLRENGRENRRKGRL